MQNIDIVAIDREMKCNLEQGAGIDVIRKQLNKLKDEVSTSKYILQRPLRLSLIGRVSTGKSSLLNILFGCDLLPVSKLQTTTCSTKIRVQGENFITIDVIRKDESRNKDRRRDQEKNDDQKKCGDQEKGCDQEQCNSTCSNSKSFSGLGGVQDHLSGIYASASSTDKVTITLPAEGDKYRWLRNVIVVDTPGIGNSEALNDAIVEQCNQSDVIIVVVKASLSIGDEEWNIFQLISKERCIAKLAYIFTWFDEVETNEIESVKFHHEVEADKLTKMILCHHQIGTYYFSEKTKNNADKILELFKEKIHIPFEIDFGLIQRHFEDHVKKPDIATTVQPKTGSDTFSNLALTCIEGDFNGASKEKTLEEMKTLNTSLTVLIKSFLDLVDSSSVRTDATDLETPYKEEALANIKRLYGGQHQWQMFLLQFRDIFKVFEKREKLEIQNKEYIMKLFVFFTELAIAHVDMKDNLTGDWLGETLMYYLGHPICPPVTKIVGLLQKASKSKTIDKKEFLETCGKCQISSNDESIRLRSFFIFTEMFLLFLYRKAIGWMSKLGYDKTYLSSLHDLMECIKYPYTEWNNFEESPKGCF